MTHKHIQIKIASSKNFTRHIQKKRIAPRLRVRCVKKIQKWILIQKNRFCISLLNRLIQDHSDQGASREPKNPCSEWVLRFL